MAKRKKAKKREAFKKRSKSFNNVNSKQDKDNTSGFPSGMKRSTSEETSKSKTNDNDLHYVSNRKMSDLQTSSHGSEENVDVDDYYVKT